MLELLLFIYQRGVAELAANPHGPLHQVEGVLRSPSEIDAVAVNHIWRDGTEYDPKRMRCTMEGW